MWVLPTPERLQFGPYRQYNEERGAGSPALVLPTPTVLSRVPLPYLMIYLILLLGKLILLYITGPSKTSGVTLAFGGRL